MSAISEEALEAPPGLEGLLPKALLALTFVTGVIEAAAFLGLGQVFTAMMTGNVLFLGFGIADAAGSSAWPPILALATFVVGGTVGGLIAARWPHRRGRELTAGVILEAALIGAAAILAAALSVREGEAAALLLIGLMAFAMGARNTIVRRMGVSELPTNIVFVALASFQAGTSMTGASPEHLVPRLAAVAAMLLGATAGALLVRVDLALVLGCAAGLSLLTVGVFEYAVRARERTAGAAQSP
jgi:uncharacterized membrane protein YoaK (UPF0700 family)